MFERVQGFQREKIHKPLIRKCPKLLGPLAAFLMCASLLFDFLVTLSTPIIKTIYYVGVSGTESTGSSIASASASVAVKVGVWGYCSDGATATAKLGPFSKTSTVGGGCSTPTIGWTFPSEIPIPSKLATVLEMYTALLAIVHTIHFIVFVLLSVFWVYTCFAEPRKPRSVFYLCRPFINMYKQLPLLGATNFDKEEYDNENRYSNYEQLREQHKDKYKSTMYRRAPRNLMSAFNIFTFIVLLLDIIFIVAPMSAADVSVGPALYLFVTVFFLIYLSKGLLSTLLMKAEGDYYTTHQFIQPLPRPEGPLSPGQPTTYNSKAPFPPATPVGNAKQNVGQVPAQMQHWHQQQNPQQPPQTISQRFMSMMPHHGNGKETQGHTGQQHSMAGDQQMGPQMGGNLMSQQVPNNGNNQTLPQHNLPSAPAAAYQSGSVPQQAGWMNQHPGAVPVGHQFPPGQNNMQQMPLYSQPVGQTSQVSGTSNTGPGMKRMTHKDLHPIITNFNNQQQGQIQNPMAQGSHQGNMVGVPNQQAPLAAQNQFNPGSAVGGMQQSMNPANAPQRNQTGKIKRKKQGNVSFAPSPQQKPSISTNMAPAGSGQAQAPVQQQVLQQAHFGGAPQGPQMHHQQGMMMPGGAAHQQNVGPVVNRPGLGPPPQPPNLQNFLANSANQAANPQAQTSGVNMQRVGVRAQPRPPIPPEMMQQHVSGGNGMVGPSQPANIAAQQAYGGPSSLC
ncbi:hypothetical protein SCHPADRAFT_432643 [Schizopora paradoxa]|uniref:Uncharacterized protein n=1 Tax=Schizopora paradoxa TaxID=27342 RepID=A0A0H2RRY9_9AGAM|nr:hypothetical protein SCHPADRAFT_432643 [Schizopora paradoxa]